MAIELARAGRDLAPVDGDRGVADDALALADDRRVVEDAALGLGRRLDPFELEAARPVLLQRVDRHARSSRVRPR